MTHAGDDEANDTGLPLYLQVASTLRTAILREIYPVGTRLPTEEALCERFAVSRHTIREALRQLRSDGLITSRPGSRPIVASPLVRAPEVLARDIGADFFDYTIGTRLDIATMDTARIAPSLAQELGLPSDEEWLCVKGYRVNVEDGHATCWNEYFIRPDYALIGRLLKRHVGPVIPLLEDLFETRIARITRSISAVAMPPEACERLDSQAGVPALRIVVRSETSDGTVAFVNRSLHPRGVLTYAIQR